MQPLCECRHSTSVRRLGVKCDAAITIQPLGAGGGGALVRCTVSQQESFVGVDPVSSQKYAAGWCPRLCGDIFLLC